MSQLNPPAKKIKADAPDRKRPGPKKRLPKKITESYLHNSGIYYLQRFTASSAHFRKVMMGKIDRSCACHKDQDREACAKMLDALILKFQELGLLNDEAYSRGMVQSMRRRGLSGRMICARLSAKGLGQDDIANAMQRYEDDLEGSADLIAALRLARRKRLGPYRTETPADSDSAYNKALGTMARAGFSFDISKRVLDMDAEEAAEISESGDW